MPLSPNQLQARAIEIVVAGLNSGSIKLRGSVNSQEVEQAGVMDGKYLASLVNHLTSALAGPQADR